MGSAILGKKPSSSTHAFVIVDSLSFSELRLSREWLLETVDVVADVLSPVSKVDNVSSRKLVLYKSRHLM